MNTKLILDDLEFLENGYIATLDNKGTIEDFCTYEPRKRMAHILPENTPRKFLEEDLAQKIAKELQENDVSPKSIWLLPYDFNELDGGRNTIIVVTVSPENANPNNYRAERIHHLIRHFLRRMPIGEIWPFVTWDCVLESRVPNPILPRYNPTWTI